MNLKDNLQMAAGELRSAGVPEPELDAWYLRGYGFGWNRAFLIMRIRNGN